MTTWLRQAVILAGGRGERLRPLTDSLPKPLAPVNGAPFLDYLLDSLSSAGVDRVLLLLGYRADDIRRRYLGRRENPAVDFSVGAASDQTGDRLLRAFPQLDDHFLLLYGDNYWPLELEAMAAFYRNQGKKISTTVFRNAQGTGEYGRENNVRVDAAGLVEAYDKTRKSPGLNGVDIGYFIVDKTALPAPAQGPVSFEEDILPSLIARKQVAAYLTDVQYYFITDRPSLLRFETAVRLGSVPSL